MGSMWEKRWVAIFRSRTLVIFVTFVQQKLEELDPGALVAEQVQFSNVYSKSKRLRQGRQGKGQIQGKQSNTCKQICQGAGKNLSPIKQAKPREKQSQDPQTLGEH